MKINDSQVELESQVKSETKSTLEDIVKAGACDMLQRAIEVEVSEYIDQHQGVTKKGNRLVVRNGWRQPREIQTGIGNLPICQPRVNDQRSGKKFISRILPPYLRRLPSLNSLIPALYLKGISTGNLMDALQSILGEKAKGLSPANVVRLKTIWEEEYQQWLKRDFKGKKYVYFWVDGIYFNVRLTDERPCLLVIIGTLSDGTKELITVADGERESKLSWQAVLRDLKKRGLTEGPKLAVGDGALGFWTAWEEEFPGADQQRCWVHKTANILDKLPKKVQPGAKKLICEMYMSATKKDALDAYDEFLKRYQVKHPRAGDCLIKDKDVLFTFYNYPAEHWGHIRSTNVIESTFATVRHRTRQTKGCGSRMATLTMVFKLSREAEKHWRRIAGYELIEKVIQGIKFIDGIEAIAA